MSTTCGRGMGVIDFPAMTGDLVAVKLLNGRTVAGVLEQIGHEGVDVHSLTVGRKWIPMGSVASLRVAVPYWDRPEMRSRIEAAMREVNRPLQAVKSCLEEEQ